MKYIIYERISHVSVNEDLALIRGVSLKHLHLSVEYACLGVAVGFGSRISRHISGCGAVTAVLIIRQVLVDFRVHLVSRPNTQIVYTIQMTRIGRS